MLLILKKPTLIPKDMSTVLASAGFDDFSTHPGSCKVFPKIPELVAWTADVYIVLLSAVSLSGILSSFRH